MAPSGVNRQPGGRLRVITAATDVQTTSAPPAPTSNVVPVASPAAMRMNATTSMASKMSQARGERWMFMLFSAGVLRDGAKES